MIPAPSARRLLIIDDDPGLLDAFELFMRREGFQVACAEDGVKGLAKAAVFKPELIVLDLMMPNLGGLEVIHRLQAQGLGDIPVVIVTGFSKTANVEILHQEPNVVEFLEKPLRYGELAALIRRVLGEK